MNFLRSPKNKLLLAGALVAVLAFLAPATGQSVTSLARWILAALSVAGIAWWLSRARGRRDSSGFSLDPKLEVLARTGLSPKCGVALVEADGRKYLIVHGEGFAKIRETRPQIAEASTEVSRPSPRRSDRKLVLS